jgi:hypothetical protein
VWKSKVQRTQAFSWTGLATDTILGGVLGAAGGQLGKVAAPALSRLMLGSQGALAKQLATPLVGRAVASAGRGAASGASASAGNVARNVKAIANRIAPKATPATETGGGTVQLFRSVDAAEFDSIATTGRFSIAPGQMEGKFFATTGEHAEQWGQLLHRGDAVTVETRVPQSVADQLFLREGKLDGVGPARYADRAQLDLINDSMDGIRLWP